MTNFAVSNILFCERCLGCERPLEGEGIPLYFSLHASDNTAETGR